MAIVRLFGIISRPAESTNPGCKKSRVPVLRSYPGISGILAALAASRMDPTCLVFGVNAGTCGLYMDSLRMSC